MEGIAYRALKGHWFIQSIPHIFITQSELFHGNDGVLPMHYIGPHPSYKDMLFQIEKSPVGETLEHGRFLFVSVFIVCLFCFVLAQVEHRTSRNKHTGPGIYI